MPIVSQQIEDSIQADGSHSVVVRFYDQTGQVYMQSFHLHAGGDIDSVVNLRKADMDVHLAEMEFEALVGAA